MTSLINSLENKKINFITDYVKPCFNVPTTELSFQINKDHTIVTANYEIVHIDNDIQDLVLYGDKSVILEEISCNNIRVPHRFINDSEELIIRKEYVEIIKGYNYSFTLKVVCKIYPDKNTELQGLYRSGNTYCTQCETTGFRRIVYSFDRPDILSKYTVIIITDAECPVILSNGNMTANIFCKCLFWINNRI